MAVLLVGLALFVGGARCAGPDVPPGDHDCVALSEVCPSLTCVEFAYDTAGCPLCECKVQACLVDTDCAEREVWRFCDLASTTCEPAPACTDADPATVCPAACWGRCLYPERNPGLCDGPEDCAAGNCRRSVCVDDPATPATECLGWCVEGCDPGVTIGRNPQTGECGSFPDACLPPGWVRAATCP